MRILIAVVHYWNPDGGGIHQSLCPDPNPRVQALRNLILSLRRLGKHQYLLDISSRSVIDCNKTLLHDIDICVINDGTHHVLDLLGDEFDGSYTFVSASPQSPKHLGFEAQRFLASKLDEYDMVGFMEDDLVIHDPLFFSKIFDFQHYFGPNHLLLPHRIEFSDFPHIVDRFYIDGQLHPNELVDIIKDPSPDLTIDSISKQIHFSSPANPHSGCFFLTNEQMSMWFNHESWDDGDTSWISPLESAATLGISKVFSLYKPSFSNASWLEIQHWGQTFHCKICPPIPS